MFNDSRKERIIINIRNLNIVIQTNVYFLSFQSNLIILIKSYRFFNVIDYINFFY